MDTILERQQTTTSIPSEIWIPCPLLSSSNRNRHKQTCACENEGFVLVNRLRRRHGRPPLCQSETLNELAKVHAQQMARAKDLSCRQISHLQGLLKNRWVGEIVQRSSGTESIQIHVLFLAAIGRRGSSLSGRRRSSSSFRNMLSSKFSQFGMGTALGHDGKLYVCQLFSR
jgi:hypothetical protein